MIAKMDKLAQLIQLFTTRSGPGRPIRAALILACFASACNPGGVEAPAPRSVETEAPPATPPQRAPEPAPEFEGMTAHPLAEWTYAESLEELHSVWVERFALGAAPSGNPDAIWPYADAVLIDGDSWGMAPDTTRLIYVKADNHAYQRAGAAHPVANDGAATAISAEALSALGWEKARNGAGLQRFDEGPGFRVAGPIRAAHGCQACHAYGEGEVVALLVYDFEEIPDD